MSKHLSVKQAQLLNRHRYILKKLAATSNKNRKIILKNAPQELFRALTLVFNLLANDKLSLSRRQGDKIKKHKRLIRSTSDLKTTAIKRKLQGQSGGALPAILAAALPIIGSLIKSII